MDLGRQPYCPVLALQEHLVAERVAGRVPDTLVLVEHDPVYTMGRRQIPGHITAPAEQLARMGIEVVPTSRGGDVTYHGPGQLVGYPILHLGDIGRGAVWYVTQLEDVLIRTLHDFGIEAGRDAANRGVWVGRRKVAAIGVRITRQVTQHGFALNVAPDMTHYAGIVPCGLRDRGVTSMRLLGVDASLGAVADRLIAHLGVVFDYPVVRSVPSPLPASLGGVGV